MFLDGDDVIVVAARAMPAWKVTKFRKTAVVLEGRTWYVAGYEPPTARRTNPARGVGHRYRLTPWPEDLHDLPASTFDYDAQRVVEREEERRDAVERLSRWFLLAPFYPLLGFLPSGVKAELAELYGVRAQTTTRQSLRVEYVTAIVFIGMIVPQIVFDDPLGLGVALPAALGLGALVDFAVRWDRSTEEHPLQYGAFEWIFRRLDPRRAVGQTDR